LGLGDLPIRLRDYADCEIAQIGIGANRPIAAMSQSNLQSSDGQIFDQFAIFNPKICN
jgi:hypothetical protein